MNILQFILCSSAFLFFIQAAIWWKGAANGYGLAFKLMGLACFSVAVACSVVLFMVTA